MESYALLIGATLSAGTVLAIAALGLLINEKAVSYTHLTLPTSDLV